LYRKILVPLDGSSQSESILGQAGAMVKECGVSELVLLTVVEPFRGQPFRKDDDWNIKIQKEGVRVAGNYLQALQEKLMLEGVKVNVEVIMGDPAQEILTYAVKNEIDLIMMNAKGRSANTRWVFGSVANKIIDHSPIPVLINSTTRIS
jgi:nucleotide-binding universal stress UspA family protein